MSKIPSKVKIVNKDGQEVNPSSEDTLKKIMGFDIPPYDYIYLGYTGSDITTVVYKSGGSEGIVVATLTLTYNAGKLETITKT